MRYWQNKTKIMQKPGQVLTPGLVQILRRVSQLLKLRNNSDIGGNVPNMFQHVPQLPTTWFCDVSNTCPSLLVPAHVSMATGAFLSQLSDCKGWETWTIHSFLPHHLPVNWLPRRGAVMVSAPPVGAKCGRWRIPVCHPNAGDQN